MSEAEETKGVPEAGWQSRRRELARLVLIVLGCYVATQLVLVPGGHIQAFPFHHDDYDNLSHTRIEMPGLGVRPISTLVLVLLSALGKETYYATLQVLTVSCVLLAFSFVLEMLRVRRVSGWLCVAASVVVFSFEHLAAYRGYTGLITNLTSAATGLAAMIVLLRYVRAESAGPSCLALGVTFSMVSILCKEDFILAILLVPAAAVLGVEGRGGRRRGLVALAVLAVAAGAWLAYSAVVVKSPFVSGSDGPYRTSFAISSLATTVVRYLGMTRVTIAAAAGATALAALSMILLPWRRASAAILLTGVWLSLIGPYACLPGHVFDFYCFNWLPLQAAAIFLVDVIIEKGASAWRARIARAVVVAGAVALWWTSRGLRSSVSEWFSSNAKVNETIVATLTKLRPLLEKEGEIGVIGVPVLCPWFGVDGEYLERRLGLHCRWRVFVEKDGDYEQRLLAFQGGRKKGLIETVPLEALSERPLPLLILSADGRGTLRAAGLDAPLNRGRKRGFTPEGDAATGVEFSADPNPIPVCRGVESGMTLLRWSGPCPEGCLYEIRAGGEDGKVFARTGGGGESRTGPWVTHGARFSILRKDGPDRAWKLLGVLVVEHEPGECP